MLNSIIIIVSLLLQSASFPHSSSKFDRISLQDGLSDPTVTGIAQDSIGYIWLATRDGLNKFDGISMEIYKPGYENSEGLRDGWIETMIQGDGNTLWLGTQNSGFYAFDTELKQFVNYSAENSVLLDNQIYDLALAPDGKIWIATSEGLHSYDPQHGVFQIYRADSENARSLVQNYVSVVEVVDENEIWVGYWGGGVSQINLQEGSYTHYNSRNSALSSNYVYSLLHDDGDLWIGTVGGLNRYNHQNNTFNTWYQHPDPTRGLSNNGVRDLLKQDDMLWIATGNGLTLFHPGENRFMQFMHNQAVESTISGITVLSLFLDESEALWAGTINGGVSRLDPYRNKFHHHTIIPNGEHTLSNNYIRSFYERENGDVWIGTWSGVDLWQRSEHRITQMFKAGQGQRGLPDHRVYSLIEDHSGNLWVGTWDGGLAKLPAHSSLFTYYNDSEETHGLTSTLINKVFVDSDGKLWVGTHDEGLFYYDAGDDQFTHFPLNTRYGFQQRVNHIFEDKQNRLWISGQRSVSLIEDNSFKKSFVNEFGEARFTGDIRSVAQDKEGNIWIGTGNYGLCKLENISEDQFLCFNEFDGLPHNNVWGVLADDEGYLWLSTSNGFARFSTQTHTFRNYNESDGLQGLQFAQGAFFKTQSGEMFFGGTNGFNHFDPQFVRDKKRPPQIVFRDMRIITRADSSVFREGIKQDIVLDAKENFFVITFNALDYTDPDRNLYSYKMEGLDQDWSMVSNVNTANYTNVPPGSYTFRVRAANPDGVWNEQGVGLNITIVPPFWQQQWFVGLMVSTVLFILFLLVQSRERRYKNMKTKLEQMVKERTHSLQHQTKLLTEARKDADKANLAKSEFLAGISHELRTPLNAIIGFSQILSKDSDLNHRQKHYVDVMQKSGSHLLDMINDVLDISQIESGKLEPNIEDFLIKDMLRSIVAMFDMECRDKGISLIINLDRNLPDVIRSDAGKIRQILINIMGNAVKFTDNGSVSLSVSLSKLEDIGWAEHTQLGAQSEALLFQVSDTGWGISEKDAKTIFEPFYRTGDQRNTGTGLGLTISRKLTEVLQGKLQFSSKLGEGSVFEWYIPLLETIDSAVDKEVKRSESVAGLKPEASYSILSVDDNPENAELIKSIVEANGFRYFLAETGEEAIEKYRMVYPNLVLMDISLPGISGIEAAEQIRKISGDSVPIIAVTAGVFGDFKDLAGNHIFDGYVLKPFNHSDLLLEISKHLNVTVMFSEQSRELEQDEKLTQIANEIQNLPEGQREQILEALELSDFTMLNTILSEMEFDEEHVFTDLKSAIQDKEYTLILNLTEYMFN